VRGEAEAKAALRAHMRALRHEISPAERDRLTALIEEALFSLPEVGRARKVLLFYSFGSEVGTGSMADRILDAGKSLLLPFLEDGVMEAAEVHPGEALRATDYGPREPTRRVAVDPGSVDLVVAPGLAFDRQGRRLGYGGGHYDRYLGRLGPEAIRIGVGFAFQVVEEVPAGPGDRRVDLVVTDTEVIDSREPPDNPTDQRR
jgi:5-formyltetrahydrofolate cyclo-ligase